MCKEMPVILVDKVVDKKRIIGKMEGQGVHMGSLTQKRSIVYPIVGISIVTLNIIKFEKVLSSFTMPYLVYITIFGLKPFLWDETFGRIKEQNFYPEKTSKFGHAPAFEIFEEKQQTYCKINYFLLPFKPRISTKNIYYQR
jgi:hypothetical protein